jgi:hypothetical protein
MNTRFQAIKGSVKIAMTFGVLGMALSSVAVAEKNSNENICSDFTILQSTPPNYALCAGATSFIFDKITYAKCLIRSGESISETLAYPHPSTNTNPPVGDITTVNQEGLDNGSFIVSTYSPPGTAVALYNCNASGSNAHRNSDAQGNTSGSYAQCDGGICFTSTTGTATESKTFPGLGAVGEGEIVCSCPIATTSEPYQVFGPSDCPKKASEYDKICGVGITSAYNGYTLYIGAPTGIPAQLSKCLKDPTKLQTCKRPVK